MKSIDEINRANVAKISAEKKLPNFFPGDIIKVGVKITEGKRDRTGKSARIAEKIRKNIGIEVETQLENTQEPIQTESQVTEDSKEDSTKKPEKKAVSYTHLTLPTRLSV